MHFAQQQFQALVRLAQFGFRLALLTFQSRARPCLPEALGEQVEKAVADGLDHEIGSTCVDCLDRNGGIVVPRNENDSGMIGHGDNFVEHLATGLARHVMIDRDEVEFLLAQSRQAIIRALCRFDGEAPPVQRALDQPPQAGVVIDIEDAIGFYWSRSGTWITERNSPS